MARRSFDTVLSKEMYDPKFCAPAVQPSLYSASLGVQGFEKVGFACLRLQWRGPVSQKAPNLPTLLGNRVHHFPREHACLNPTYILRLDINPKLHLSSQSGLFLHNQVELKCRPNHIQLTTRS
jgi:hypothetical protein